MPVFNWAVCSLIPLSLLGCTGNISSSDQSGGTALPSWPGQPSAGTPPGPGGLGATGLPPPLPLRRLSKEEYNNSVRDLLGDTTAPATAFADESTGSSGFATPGITSAVDVSRYLEAAESLANAAVGSLGALVPCDPTTGEDACAKKFVETFGRKAYRRALSSDEIADLLRVFSEASALPGGAAFADKIRVVVSAILQAPQFLYHWELGLTSPHADKGVIHLTPYETASRVSYFLWSSTPDDVLLQAAEAGQLADAQGLSKQIQRLLQDPKARSSISSFHNQWLNLKRVLQVIKDPDKYPTFDDGLRHAMADETEAFVNHVVLDSDGKLDTLLRAPFSFLNEPLAKLYGVAGVTGMDLRKVQLDPTQRSGLLTQASLLATTANAYEGSVISRGKLVREQLLCETLPPPPPGVPSLPPPSPTQSLRERSVLHSQDPICKSCHELMDPIGFGFGNYDAVGGYQTREGGDAVDASGTVSGLDGGAPKFTGPIELAATLVSSDQVRKCVATKWFRFAFRRAELPEDATSLQAVFDAFASSGYDVRALLAAVVTSPSFSYRSLAPGEVSQ